MKAPALSVSDLSYTYPGGNEALRGVSLAVEGGERLAVLGHNGAGKSTLVRHFNGLLAPTQGEVRVGGLDTRRAAVEELSRSVGYVFQNPDDQLFAKTIREEAAFGPKNLGYARDRVEALVADALELCGLAALAGRHPYDVPFTKRRWVAIASVVAMDTPILVLDEPTAGQDAHGLEQLASLIESLNRQGKTIITISHDLTFCAENFARAVVLRNGAVLYDGDFRTVVRERSLLDEAGLQLPQVTRLGFELGMPRPLLKLSEFLPAYREAFLGRAGRVED